MSLLFLSLFTILTETHETLFSLFLHSAIRKSKRSSNSLLFHKYHLYMKTIFYLYILILAPLF